MTRQTPPGVVISPTGTVHQRGGNIIGWDRRGRPIRLVAGGSGEGSGGAAGGGDGGSGGGDGGAPSAGSEGGGGVPPTPPPPVPPAPPAPTPQPSPAPPAPPAGSGGGGDDPPASGETGGTAERVEDLPPWAQKRIKDLAKEAGDHRIKAKTAATEAKEINERLAGFLDGFAKVLGLAEDEEKPLTPEQMTAQIADLTRNGEDLASKLRAARVELAAWRTGSAHDADTRELLDSRDFFGRITGLDPDAEEFPGQLSELIKTAVESNPAKFRLAAARAAQQAPSGGEFSGGPAGERNVNEMDVDELLKKRREWLAS